jgi:hypothetical protein
LISTNDLVGNHAADLRIDQIKGFRGQRAPQLFFPQIFLEAGLVATGFYSIHTTRLLKFIRSQKLLQRVSSEPEIVRKAYIMRCQAARVLLRTEMHYWLTCLMSWLIMVFILFTLME